MQVSNKNTHLSLNHFLGQPCQSIRLILRDGVALGEAFGVGTSDLVVQAPKKAPAGARGLGTPKSLARARQLGARPPNSPLLRGAAEDPWDVSMLADSHLVLPPPHPLAIRHHHHDPPDSRVSHALLTPPPPARLSLSLSLSLLSLPISSLSLPISSFSLSLLCSLGSPSLSSLVCSLSYSLLCSLSHISLGPLLSSDDESNRMLQSYSHSSECLCVCLCVCSRAQAAV